MDDKFNAILSVVLIPQTVALISEKENIDDISATKEFYNSQTYEYVSKEETKMWHFSPMILYTIWKNEKETGEVVFPEE